jgi:hypothetical protein
LNRQATRWTVVNNASLYQLSMAVCGGFFGMVGLYSLLAGVVHANTILLSVGGITMVLAAVYEAAFSADPYAPSDRTVWLVVGGSAVVVLGGAYSMFG